VQAAERLSGSPGAQWHGQRVLTGRNTLPSADLCRSCSSVDVAAERSTLRRPELEVSAHRRELEVAHLRQSERTPWPGLDSARPVRRGAGSNARGEAGERKGFLADCRGQILTHLVTPEAAGTSESKQHWLKVVSEVDSMTKRMTERPVTMATLEQDPQMMELLEVLHSFREPFRHYSQARLVATSSSSKQSAAAAVVSTSSRPAAASSSSPAAAAVHLASPPR
jgi:hypothetical protein